MVTETRIIYKGFARNESLNSLVNTLLEAYHLQGSHLTFEKRNRIYYGKISYQGKYVVSKKDADLENLADKIITLLHTQIRNYEKRKSELIYRYSEEESKERQIQKIKKFVVKPTDLDNALDHMKILGHKFYVYVDTNDKPILLFLNDGEVYSQTIFTRFTVEEAINHLKENNDSYIAFQNTDTEELTVVYQRKTGDIGIIDTSL